MNDKQMLLKLIETIEAMNEAKIKYENHPGGGASQKIKNKLFQNYSLRFTEMNNAVFNIKQLLK